MSHPRYALLDLSLSDMYHTLVNGVSGLLNQYVFSKQPLVRGKKLLHSTIYSVHSQNLKSLSCEIRAISPIGNEEYVIIMIPGNPGVPSCYDKYLLHLHSLHDTGNMNALCIGHANHSKSAVSDSEIHSLQTQIEHKRLVIHSLFNNPQKKQIKFILIGHSVGGHICLELMRDKFIQSHTAKVLCLFPTVQNIGRSPNGVRLYPLFKHGREFAGMVTQLIASLPVSMQTFILRRALSSETDLVPEALANLSELVHPIVCKNALYMAFTECHEINELEAIIDHEKVVFYFGVDDGWVHNDDIDDIQRKFPSVKLMRCRDNHGHSFVLSNRSSAGMSVITWELLREVVSGKTESASRKKERASTQKRRSRSRSIKSTGK
jgi:Lipid-droplet associated hydrolase